MKQIQRIHQEINQMGDKLNFNTKHQANIVIFQVQEHRVQHLNNLILLLFLLFISHYQEQLGKVNKSFRNKNMNAKENNLKLRKIINSVLKFRTNRVMILLNKKVNKIFTLI